ncbi:hypothetical protein HNY73_010142 [Argiope bruennichi]|uniref:Uncharacterized protein n=1 Tax=Argiope bruennichi TaxID=94029 RepID=A0A8T0F2E8_ARGBR|nr:hypothetical protein HNY73_010142 [Argiope bruennichi]
MRYACKGLLQMIVGFSEKTSRDDPSNRNLNDSVGRFSKFKEIQKSGLLAEKNCNFLSQLHAKDLDTEVEMTDSLFPLDV